MAEDTKDLKTLIEHRNAMLEILKTSGIDNPEKFRQESEQVIQDFAVACVQDKADDLTA